MALTRFAFELGAAGEALSAAGRQCFFCGSRIERDPAVCWWGASTVIYLHGPCAGDLLLRLARDLHEWQLTTGTEFAQRS